MRIDIWSDIVCPFCYIGKRHLELALERFEHRDQVEVVWHSFELDPTIEAVSDQPLAEKIASKYGISLAQSEASQESVAERAASVGLEFNWREAKFGNTFDAHRLVHLAATHGLADTAHERLMRAYFTEGVAVGDHAELQRLGEEIGLPADEVRRVLAEGEYADAVREDEEQARGLGVSGVPFFVLDQRLAVSGAQPVELFTQALERAWRESQPLETLTAGTPGGDDASCSGDSCAI